MHGLLNDYVADYIHFNGDPDDKEEYLKEIYKPCAVNISFL